MPLPLRCSVCPGPRRAPSAWAAGAIRSVTRRWTPKLVGSSASADICAECKDRFNKFRPCWPCGSVTTSAVALLVGSAAAPRAGQATWRRLSPRLASLLLGGRAPPAVAEVGLPGGGVPPPGRTLRPRPRSFGVGRRPIRQCRRLGGPLCSTACRRRRCRSRPRSACGFRPPSACGGGALVPRPPAVAAVCWPADRHPLELDENARTSHSGSGVGNANKTTMPSMQTKRPEVMFGGIR